MRARSVKNKHKQKQKKLDPKIRNLSISNLKFGNFRSLVVDIHLPPASEDDEDESEVEKAPMPVQSVAQPQQPQRPFKHEVNRFQRCYSDGSQASPKRKGKVKNFEFNPNFSTNKSCVGSFKKNSVKSIFSIV